MSLIAPQAVVLAVLMISSIVSSAYAQPLEQNVGSSRLVTQYMGTTISPGRETGEASA
jgi:hypothetical protein